MWYAHLIIEINVGCLQCLERFLNGMFDIGRLAAYFGCPRAFSLFFDDAEFSGEENLGATPRFCKPGTTQEDLTVSS